MKLAEEFGWTEFNRDARYLEWVRARKLEWSSAPSTNTISSKVSSKVSSRELSSKTSSKSSIVSKGLTDRDGGVARVAGEKQKKILKMQKVIDQIKTKVDQMKTTLATLTGDEKKKQEVKIQKFTKQREEIKRILEDLRKDDVDRDEKFRKEVSDDMAQLGIDQNRKCIWRIQSCFLAPKIEFKVSKSFIPSHIHPVLLAY